MLDPLLVTLLDYNTRNGVRLQELPEKLLGNFKEKKEEIII